MPKQTFLNLPQEKQQRLLDAGFKEFSRVPSSEASISNIVKLAEIPRGSFYQYFEDKFDLHAYLVTQFSQNWYQAWRQLLKQADGDLFATLQPLFTEVLNQMTDERYENFWRNTLTQFHNSVSIRKALRNQPHIYRDDNKMIDSTKFKIKLTHRNYLILRGQIITMTMQSLSLYFFSDRFDVDNPKKEALNNFATLLNWLQYGIKAEGCELND